jgi:hypothetical protein
MKKKHTIIISCVLVASIIFFGLAFAESQRKGDRQGFGFKQRHKSGGLMLLAKYQQKNLKVEALSEMTGQPVDTINAMIKEQRMRALIQELNIDRQAFRDLMQSKVSERVKQAAANRSITPEQEKEILAKMELRSKRRELKIKRRELMSKLVENGIKDGTITQDEALMLKRKPR